MQTLHMGVSDLVWYQRCKNHSQPDSGQHVSVEVSHHLQIKEHVPSCRSPSCARSPATRREERLGVGAAEQGRHQGLGRKGIP